MKLLDYHRLRREEESSWDRPRLREAAGAEFTHTAGQLLPHFDEPWSPDHYTAFTRTPWFDDCARLCAIYRSASDAQRTWLRSRMDHATAGKLGVFGLRAAVLAARKRAPELARDALTAFAIADLAEGDIRDVLIGLSLLCHCTALSGADVPALFRETAAVAGPAIRTLFEEWAARYPDVASIGSMGWKQVETPDGVGFRL